MTALNCDVSRCGVCKFYSHEGRRGGRCSQLSVPVDSQWKACGLARSPFVSSLQDDEGITDWIASSAISAAERLPVPLPKSPLYSTSIHQR
mgnify:CR=1 FL=1